MFAGDLTSFKDKVNSSAETSKSKAENLEGSKTGDGPKKVEAKTPEAVRKQKKRKISEITRDTDEDTERRRV